MSYHPADYSADFDRFLGHEWDTLPAARGIIAELAALKSRPVVVPADGAITMRGRIAPSEGEIADFRLLPRAQRLTGGHLAYVAGRVPKADYTLSLRVSGAVVGHVTFPAGQRQGVVTAASEIAGVLELVGGPVDQEISHFMVTLCTSST